MSTALSKTIPAPTSNFPAYFQAVQAFPMLTQEEETQLARQLRDELGDFGLEMDDF